MKTVSPFNAIIESTKNECEAMLESLRKAWALVKHKLKYHNKSKYHFFYQYQ